MAGGIELHFSASEISNFGGSNSAKIALSAEFQGFFCKFRPLKNIFRTLQNGHSIRHQSIPPLSAGRQNCLSIVVVCNFYTKALFCALLRSFALNLFFFCWLLFFAGSRHFRFESKAKQQGNLTESTLAIFHCKRHRPTATHRQAMTHSVVDLQIECTRCIWHLVANDDDHG